MIRKRLLQALLVMVLFFTASLCHAITMDVTLVDDTVTVKMIASGGISTTLGRFAVDFGDGSPVEQSPVMSFPAVVSAPPPIWSATHTYAQGGNYVINGSWVSISPPNPNPPLVVIKQVSIVLLSLSPDTLPTAAVAEEYEEQFNAEGGTRPYRYRVISGRLPTGISLDTRGKLSGTPNQLGRYRFTVQVFDARGENITQQYELEVGSGEATVRVLPAIQKVSRQGMLSSPITYEYVGTAVQDRLYSSRGEFRVGGSVVGYNNKGLTLNVRNGKARSSESVTIPLTVIRRAEQLKSTKITYNRYFKSRSLLGRATCTFILTPGGGELRLTRMRLFFENNRPRIVVARSSRDLNASVAINYTGSGLLKGYWEVDGRIIQRVQKNVRFGKLITLTTPTVPPLPTYAEGPHRIRFVVTSPAQGIPFPVAYYDVVEQEKSRRAVIVLQEPGDKAQLQVAGAVFSWQQRKEAATYLVSFFDQNSKEEEPVYSAYTKTKSYTLPSQAAEQFFKSGDSYDWLVVGINQDGKIVGESKIRSFSVEPSE